MVTVILSTGAATGNTQYSEVAPPDRVIVFKPLECKLVDALTGQPIAEHTFKVNIVGADKPTSHTLAVKGSFHFIKPKAGDIPEKRITVRAYVSKSSNRITMLIPDDIMRRADRDDLLLEWQLGNAPVYKDYEPIERIPLKQILSDDPGVGRDSFRKIKLTPMKKAKSPSKPLN